MPIKIIKERVSSSWRIGLQGNEDEIHIYANILKNYCIQNIELEKYSDCFYGFLITEKQFLRTRAAQILNTVTNRNEWSYKAALDKARDEWDLIDIERFGGFVENDRHVYNIHPKARMLLEGA